MSDPLKPSRAPDPAHQVRITPEIVRRWVDLYAEAIRDSERRLTQLDAFIGDGDHGANMQRGMDAVVAKFDEMAPAQLAGQFRAISTVLITSVGGAAGPLYGTFFLQAAQTTANKTELTLADLAAAVDAGCGGVVNLGKAAVGDKTMVDTLAAAVASLQISLSRQESLLMAARNCREATFHAAVATTPMIARKGRASYLGERSAGFQDPGATSVALLFDALAQALATSPAPRVTPSASPQATLATP
jgi:phosphoenolpyruvate---glycerone phosphotransferase subunit DhaL